MVSSVKPFPTSPNRSSMRFRSCRWTMQSSSLSLGARRAPRGSRRRPSILALRLARSSVRKRQDRLGGCLVHGIKLATHGRGQFLGWRKDTTVRHPPALAGGAEHDATDPPGPDHLSYQGRFLAGTHIPHRHICTAIPNEDQHGEEVTLSSKLLLDQLVGGQQPPLYRSRAPEGQGSEGVLGQLDARGRTQNDGGGLVPEGDQAHPISPLIGIDQEREDCRLRGQNLPLALHGAAAVHHEEEQIPHLPLSDLGVEVGNLHLEARALPITSVLG